MTNTNSAAAAMAGGATGSTRSARTAGVVHIDNDGVRMCARRELRIRHVADTVRDGIDECFGGDGLGHWKVGRINRILDALDAPVKHLPIPLSMMRSMAQVGAPDMVRVGRYVGMGRATMPPLSFVSVGGGDASDIRTMLVDGHHRLMALAMMPVVGSVPARILPQALERDVRILKIGEVAVFPEFDLPRTEVDLARCSS